MEFEIKKEANIFWLRAIEQGVGAMTVPCDRLELEELVLTINEALDKDLANQ